MVNTLKREPVLLGAALTVTADGLALIAGVAESTQAILHGIVVAWVAWVVRSLSTPTAKVDEQTDTAVAIARHETLEQVRLLATPAKKAPAKKASPAKR